MSIEFYAITTTHSLWLCHKSKQSLNNICQNPHHSHGKSNVPFPANGKNLSYLLPVLIYTVKVHGKTDK